MLLRIEDLRVRYGGISALNGISIDVPEGETVLLAGDHVSILMPGEKPDVAMELVRLCTGT